MTNSSLLSPITALRIVWAQTGSFSDDDHSQLTALEARNVLKNIQLAAEKDRKEKIYITAANSVVESGLRSLDIVYKSRQDNFKETEKLRKIYMQSITDSLEFGKKTGDFLKSLPTMTVTAAGGITLAQAFGDLSTTAIWTLALALGAAGYLINLWFVNISRKKTQINLIRHDYERNLYYQQYIDRVAAVLVSLYYDLDRIHKHAFGSSYPIGDKKPGDLIDEILYGVKPTLCQFAYKHFSERKITPELWPICETGEENVIITCPFWKDESA